MTGEFLLLLLYMGLYGNKILYLGVVGLNRLLIYAPQGHRGDGLNCHCVESQSTESRHDRDRHQRANVNERIPHSEGQGATANKPIVKYWRRASDRIFMSCRALSACLAR